MRIVEYAKRKKAEARGPKGMTMNPVELFYVTSRIANLHGYRNVPIQWFVAERAHPLFGPGGWLGVPYERVIEGYSLPDSYGSYGPFGCEGVVEECFTGDEAKAFVGFIQTHRAGTTNVLIEPVKLPIGNNRMGIGDQPVGGDTDFLTIGDSPDYDLPFKVWGLMDFSDCEFDESLSGAKRKQQGFILHPDGDMEPWLLEDPPKRQ